MLFVLSAAARFHAKPTVECAVRSTPRLNSMAKALAHELRKLEPKDIKKQLHVNDALAKDYAKHLGNFEGHTPVAACTLYDSATFNTMSAQDMDDEDGHWTNSHLRIFSGLYGLLKPFDEIQPLGLPVSLGTKLTTSKGKFLRDYWRDSVHKELHEALQRLPMPVIVNCAAEEDTAGILDLDLLPEYTSITNVEFRISDKDDAGAARGEFIRWAMENRCMTVEELLDFKGLIEDGEAATYRVAPKAAGANNIVFEEASKGGGWSKQLADFGGSKSKFIKEVASQKNRYKRTEINKALVKESKKGRKVTSFC